jgi:hypothetical protein
LAENGILIRPVSALVLIGRSHMSASVYPAVFQRNVVLALPIAVVAWAIAVPGFLTLSNFVALAVLLAGCAWLLQTLRLGAQPTGSLARVVHETDAAARDRRAKTR